MNAKQCLEKMICYLRKCYEIEHNKKYLMGILLHIQVYLEMGYDYDENKECFDYILKLLGTDRKTIFPKNFTIQLKLNLINLKLEV